MVDQHSTSSPPSASGANAGAGAGANRGIVDLAEGGDAGPSLPPHVRGIHKYALPGSPSEKQVIRVPETERYRVRAVYDFEAADDSALSFRAGDIIDVLTMLPSGWWDGMLDSARGWFPSNYVEDCDDSDLDDGDEYDDEGYPLSDNYIVIRPDGQAVQRGSGGGDMLGLEGRRQKQQQQWNAWDGDDDANGERTIQGDAGAESTIHASEGIWIPFLNSAGEVHYRHTRTGEESRWMPSDQLAMSANTSQNGDVASEAGGWTYGAGARRDSLASSQPSRPISVNEDFRAPPGRGHGVPHPWVARLSDDGRSWLYYNQATGETRQDPPPAPTHLDGADTPYRAGPGDKLSHNQVWEERVRTSLAPLYATPARPTLAALVEHTRAAIAQVHEAALRGIAADEQLSVARRTHQGLALAMQDDENAIELATRALDDVVTTVRRMVVAFGYVGPVIPARTGDDAETADEGDDTMQRPAWADNMTLVGNLGLIQYMTHLAITGPRKEPSDSSWNQVMRAATKLGEVINSMPTVIFPEEDEFDPNSKQGRRLMAWFGADSLGDFMSGRFGFGKQVQENELAPLDTASANTVQAIQDSLQAAISTATLETGTSLIEITQNLVQAVTNIDIASVIDLDGDPNVAIHEDAHAYADLVSKARHALRELDDMTHQLLGTAAEVFLQWETPGGDAARERLSHAASIVWHALTLLLSVSQQQAALLQHGNVRGFIGGRSHAAMARRAAAAAHARKQSQVSVDSRVSASERNRERERHNREPSVVSSGSHRTEFLEQDTASGSASSKRRSFRLSRTSMTSQTSIVNQNRHSSSTSSLPYQQESEAGSLRANRASILKAAVPNLGFFAGNKAGARVTKSASTKVTVGKSRSTRKAGKVLGEDVERIGNFTTAPTAPPPPVPTPLSPPPTTSPRPWYLATDYPAGEIVFDENQNVKAGTPRALVVRLTTHVDFDMTFLNKFFLTFRTFVQPQELVRLLIDRYNIEEPKDLEPAEHNEWRDKKQKPIRLRVVNSFKRWLTDYYYEQEDAICLDSIQDFAASSEQNMLQQAVDKVRGQEPPMRYSTDPAPTPIMPRGTPNGLLDMDPVEIARQMTLLEFARFTDIKPIEFLNKGQQKHGAYPNLQANMDASNRIANWVSVTIMREKDDVKARVAIFTHWINVGICLYDQLQNYSSTAFIIAGLEVTSVRLTRTVDALPEKVLKDWNKLYNGGEWFARNYHKYHLSIKHKSGPLIPFLGPYITAVVFAEEGNKDKSQVSLAASDSSTPMTPAPSSASDATTANGDAAAAPALLINFTKRQISGDIIRDLKEYQHRKYNLAECLPISKFIETAIAAVTDEEKERYQIM